MESLAIKDSQITASHHKSNEPAIAARVNKNIGNKGCWKSDRADQWLQVNTNTPYISSVKEISLFYRQN
jgi:hypothetical protein